MEPGTGTASDPADCVGASASAAAAEMPLFVVTGFVTA
jgi:hypothetical protein